MEMEVAPPTITPHNPLAKPFLLVSANTDSAELAPKQDNVSIRPSTTISLKSSEDCHLVTTVNIKEGSYCAAVVTDLGYQGAIEYKVTDAFSTHTLPWSPLVLSSLGGTMSEDDIVYNFNHDAPM